MPEKLYVHADLGDGTIQLAGQLIVDEKLGRFKYSKAYINNPRAFALDPINLPLNEDIHSKQRTRETPAMFGVLLDAGPDEWGRRWLTKTRQPPPVTQIEFLLAASGEGVGALHFTAELEDPVRPTPDRPFEGLVHLQHIASDIEAGKEVDRALEPYFFHGSGIGGARPKSLIEHDEREWIAKFNRDSDLVDMCRVELVSMQMARAAGIEVPDVMLTETDRGPVLLVERFDQSPGEQHHLVSVASLINKFDITEIDESTMSYPGICQLGKRIGRLTGDLGEDVFRRMLLNVAIGNTDDHLRNHAFMKRAPDADYSFSPATTSCRNSACRDRTRSRSDPSAVHRRSTISRPRRGAWAWPTKSPTRSPPWCSTRPRTGANKWRNPASENPNSRCSNAASNCATPSSAGTAKRSRKPELDRLLAGEGGLYHLSVGRPPGTALKGKVRVISDAAESGIVILAPKPLHQTMYIPQDPKITNAVFFKCKNRHSIPPHMTTRRLDIEQLLPVIAMKSQLGKNSIAFLGNGKDVRGILVERAGNVIDVANKLLITDVSRP